MKSSKVLRYTGLALLLLILAAGPFLQGLFFWTELLGALAALGVGFALWALGRRLGGLPLGLPGGLAGGALLALLGLYLLQFAWAVYPRGNLDWTLRVFGAWLAFVMVRAEAGPALRRWLGWAFVLSAGGLAVLGFLEYTGWLFRDPELVKTLSLVGLSTRMSTTFQYPNTAAVFFLAALLAAAGLGLDEPRPWKTALTGGLMALVAQAFFFTVSRGALVVLPFGLIFFLAGLGRRQIWPALLQVATAAAAVVVTMRGVGAASAAHQTRLAFQWVGAGVAAGAVAGLAVAYFVRLKPRVQGALAVVVVLVVIGGLVVLRPALPKQATRLLDINFRTVNAALRLVYDQDALQMAADRPLGRGGFGWDRGYRQYQDFNYTARDTHDHYLQTAVEAGWPGLAVLIAALGAALWGAWRSRGDGAPGWSLAAAAALIAGHSLIDFNLSFGVVWLLMWSLLAAAGEPPAAPARGERWLAPFLSLSSVAVAALCAALALGSYWADKAGELTEAKQPAAAKEAAQLAVKYDPLASEPRLIIGGIEELQKAKKLDPYHSGIRFKLAVALELGKDLEGALAEARAALSNQPMVSAYYTKVASLEGRLLVDDLADGRIDQAKERAQRLVQLGADFGSRKALANPKQELWGAPALEMSADFKLRYGQALYMAGRKQEAEPLLTDAAKVGLLGSEAEVWLYALYQQRGDQAAMLALAKKPWIIHREKNPVFRTIVGW